LGRTLPTFRNLLDELEAAWSPYARGLTGAERARFERLWQRARRHASASSMQSPADPLHAVFFSILLEYEAELERLRADPHDVAPGPAT
jgi:hypothetical protein